MLEFRKAELQSKIIKALAHPVRLIIIDSLNEGEKSFAELFLLFDLDKSTVSKHLSVLKNSGIISFRKSGLEMYYQLQTPCLSGIFNCVTAVIENNLKNQSCCM